MTTRYTAPPTSNLPVPPGELLAEELAAAGLSQAQLAMRMGRPPQAINEIVKGRKSITPETAVELERVLGVPAHFWLNLETTFRLALARQAEQREIAAQEQRLNDFPIAAMERLGWIPHEPTRSAKARALLKFFGVASFELLTNTVIGLRVTAAKRLSPEALAVWLRQAEIEGTTVQCAPFATAAFERSLNAARALTLYDPQQFIPELRDICASAGVAVVFVPEIPRSCANGAARWLGANKALIALSLRYRTNDHLWFSFFHEAAHILRHRQRKSFIDGTGEAIDAHEEAEANAYARDLLTPSNAWSEFVQQGDYSAAAVRAFSSSIDIHPAIVCGRLEHDGLVQHGRLHHLKMKLEWTPAKE